MNIYISDSLSMYLRSTWNFYLYFCVLSSDNLLSSFSLKMPLNENILYNGSNLQSSIDILCIVVSYYKCDYNLHIYINTHTYILWFWGHLLFGVDSETFLGSKRQTPNSRWCQRQSLHQGQPSSVCWSLPSWPQDAILTHQHLEIATFSSCAIRKCKKP